MKKSFQKHDLQTRHLHYKLIFVFGISPMAFKKKGYSFGRSCPLNLKPSTWEPSTLQIGHNARIVLDSAQMTAHPPPLPALLLTHIRSTN